MSRYRLSTPQDHDSGMQVAQRQKPQFLVFSVGPYRLGMPLLRFAEVRTLTGIVPIMRPPDYRWGQAVAYGQVVPLLDLRVELKCRAVFNSDTRILFAWRCVDGVTESQVGLIVDSVKSPPAFDEEELASSTQVGDLTRAAPLAALVVQGGRRRAIIDLDRSIFE